MGSAPASSLPGEWLGGEFSLINSGSRTFDFSNDLLTIIFSNVGSPSPDLFVFDFETEITSASVVGGNLLNLTFTFADDKLGILVSSPQQNGTVVLDLGSNNNVPEPDSFALAMLAMLGVAATRRRRH